MGDKNYRKRGGASDIKRLAIMADAATARIYQLEDQFCNGFNTQDFASAAACYRVDGTLMPPGIDEVKGRDEIGKFLKSFYESGSVHCECKILNLHKINESNIIELSHFTFKDKDGKVTAYGRWLVYWELIGDDWEITYDILSPNAS